MVEGLWVIGVDEGVDLEPDVEDLKKTISKASGKTAASGAKKSFVWTPLKVPDTKAKHVAPKAKWISMGSEQGLLCRARAY